MSTSPFTADSKKRKRETDGTTDEHEEFTFKRPKNKKPRKQKQTMSSMSIATTVASSNTVKPLESPDRHPPNSSAAQHSDKSRSPSHTQSHSHSHSRSQSQSNASRHSHSSSRSHHHQHQHRRHHNHHEHRDQYRSHSRSRHHEHDRRSRHNERSSHRQQHSHDRHYDRRSHSHSHSNTDRRTESRPRSEIQIKQEPIDPDYNSHGNQHHDRQNTNNSATPRIKTEFDESKDWNYAEEDVERQWYLHEEGEVDTEHNPFGVDDDTFVSKQDRRKQAEREKKQKLKQTSLIEQLKEKWNKKEEGKKKNVARITQLERDNAKWEEQMLERSGVIKRMNESEMVFDEEVEHRTHVLVRDMNPPFLDGRTKFSTQLKPVSVVKDNTSDMAMIARKGSATLYKWRENRDKSKMRSHEKWWEVGSASKQGQVVGVDEKQMKQEQSGSHHKEANDEEYDYKKSSRYGDAMKSGKSEAISNFAKNLSLKQQRQYLPIFRVRDELMQIIRDNQIIVLVGQTGSGKTTQLTQYCFEDGFADLDGSCIVCTQPRRVAAMSVAKRVAEETGSKLGELVGYSIRFEDCTSSATKIKYCTDGVLLRESLNKESLDKYSIVIMDEAHERSLHTDILFGVLKNVVAQRRDLKLIVTSATLDAQKFSDFYRGAPVFVVPGRTFKVETNWSKTVKEDPLDAAVKTVIKIHITRGEGDILVFMTGQEDITACCELIAERLNTAKEQQDEDTIGHLTILPIYSQLPADLQAKIFEKTPDGSRKCIVSTNIAETSLTVDGIRYVVDCGYCKLKVFKSEMGMDALSVVPISRANADQRRGRAGRTNNGEVFRLYTRLQYQLELLANTVPEIQRTNLGNVVLLLKSLGVENLLDFAFMDPPPQNTLVTSMYQLWVLGALDNCGNLTDLGNKMVQYPLDPPLSKQLMFSIELGCSDEILTIVSMLSVPTIFFRPQDPEKAEQSDAAREKFFCPESDHLTLLNIYQSWQRQKYNAMWCKQHYIHIKTMRKVREIRAQLTDIMTSKNHEIKSSDDWDIVRKAICSAYFANAAKLKGIGEYVNMRKGIPCHLHPSSALFGMGYNPEYVVYHELVMTKKEYMRNVTAVDGTWLAELGPMFFSLKDDHRARKQQEIYEKEIMEQDLKILHAQREKEKAMQQLSELAKNKQTQQVFEPANRFGNSAARQTTQDSSDDDEGDALDLSVLKKKLKRNKR